MPKIISIYQWQDEIVEDEEVLLIIKTRSMEHVRERIEQLHSYEVPEIVALDVVDVNESYHAWLQSVVN